MIAGMPLIFSPPHPALMLSWFPTAACKVNRLKEERGGGLGQCKGLVKFNRVSGDSSPLKNVNSPLHREFMDT